MARRQLFLGQAEQVVPWAALVDLITSYCPQGETGRPPFSLQTKLRVHFMQQWFTLSDPAMEDAFFDTPLYRESAVLEEFGCLPDESAILRFCHRLEKHNLVEPILALVNGILIERGMLHKTGTMVDAILIAVPSSTKNEGKSATPKCIRARRASRCILEMKGHIGAAAESGLVHAVQCTSGNGHDVTEGKSLLHGHKVVAFGDSGFQEIVKRLDARVGVTWRVAMRPGKRRALSLGNEADPLIDKAIRGWCAVNCWERRDDCAPFAQEGPANAENQSNGR